MKNETKTIIEAPVIPLVTLATISKKELSGLTKLFLRRRNSVVETRPLKPMPAKIEHIGAPAHLGVSPMALTLADRPEAAPIKPDEPLDPCYYVFKNGTDLWPKNPGIEIQFPQPVQQPAFP